MIIATVSLIRQELTSEFAEKLHVRERYAGKWLNKSIRPHYGMWRRSKIRKGSIDMWTEDEEIWGDLEELASKCVGAK